MSQSLHDVITRHVESGAFTGSVLVRRGDETLLAEAHGFAHRGFAVPNTIETRYDIASVTKTFTAVAVMQLVEKGTFALDTPVMPFLGITGTKIPDTVTVVHCLTHTSGIADDADEEAGEDYELLFVNKPNYSIRETRDFLPQFVDKEPNFAPGEGVRYNNVAFVLLGLMIEQASGVSYRDYVRQHVFERARMTGADFCAMDGINAHFAEHYKKVEHEDGRIEWRKNIYSYPPIGSPDGGATVTVSDLDRFIRAVAGAELLVESSDLVVRPHVKLQDLDTGTEWNSFGFEVVLDAEGNPVRICKDGDNIGVSSMMAYYPQSDTTIVLLANQNCSVWRMMRELEAALEKRGDLDPAVTDSDRQPGDAPFAWRQIAIIATVFAVVVSGLWQFIGAFDDTGINPPQPTASSSLNATEAVATVDATPTEPIATPDIVPGWPVGSLPALLDLAPDRLADGSLPLDNIAMYADIARWMESRGIAVPSSIDDPASVAWQAELNLLALPETLRENGLDPAWESVYGFSLFDVDQVLEVGQAPDFVLIMRGAFDPDVLQAAWVASGYQPVEVQGVTAWSLTPGDTIDLSPPASRPAMGSLNNVVLLEDGTLIAAARTSRLGDTLRVMQGGAGSLAENDALVALLTPGTGIDQVATAVLAKGTALQVTVATPAEPEATPASATPAAAREEVADMPEVKAVLIGLSLPVSTGLATPTTSEPPPLTIMLSFDDLDAAIDGRNWIVSRYASLVSPITGKPYADRFGDLTLRVVEAEDDPAAIVIDASLERGLADWLAIVADRDLGFAGWADGE